ncbi:MAG: tryptophan--tRNA ligase, partial [Bacteroidetes bacterium]|nr:tryptophan--tRNA ligase [Bacteroidota bacterium]
GNIIDPFLPDKQLRKQIMGIVTDSTPLEDPKNPDSDTVYILYKLLATPEQAEEMRQNYLRGGYGYGHAKQALYEIIITRFAEERQAFWYYMENPEELERRLQEGEAKARQIGNEVLQRVREKLGFA